MSLSPPGAPPTTMARRAVDFAASLGVLDRHVIFNERWVPYADRQRFLLAADVGVSAHYAGPEARYAFRTRLLDHFWAGLPTITSHGDVLGELVRERDLGAVVEPGDVDGWVAAIEGQLDPMTAKRVRANVAALRPELTWDRAVEPLVRLIDRAGQPVPLAFAAGRARTLVARAEIALVLRLRRAPNS